MKFTLILLVVLCSSCGGTPFDEDYWDSVADEQRQEDATNTHFSANLAPVSSVRFTNADATLNLNGNNVAFTVEMQDVPQNVVQGQVLITDAPCETFNANPPTNGTVEVRSFTYTDNTTLSSLDDSANGGSIEGKSFLAYAFTMGSVTDPPSAMFPFACGPIVRAEDAGKTTTGGTTTGTTTTTGAATAGTTTAGTTGATIPTTTVPTGTTIGTTTAGSVGGAPTTGTVEGATAGTSGTATGGSTIFIGTTFGGSGGG